MKKASGVIIGIITLVVTAALFLLLGDEKYNLSLFWIGFSVVLVLEFVVSVLLILSGGRPRRMGAVLAFTVALAVMALVSVLFIVADSSSYKWYFSILLVTVGLATAVAVVLLAHDSVVHEHQKEVESSRSYFASCRNVVMALRNSPEGKPYAAQLEQIEDDLRYADDTRFTDLDGSIRDQLAQLANKLQDPEHDPTGDFEDLRNLIRQRHYQLHG